MKLTRESRVCSRGHSGAKALLTSAEKADLIEGIRVNLPEFHHLILSAEAKEQKGIFLQTAEVLH